MANTIIRDPIKYLKDWIFFLKFRKKFETVQKLIDLWNGHDGRGGLEGEQFCNWMKKKASSNCINFTATQGP